jgi:hypothetical protein
MLNPTAGGQPDFTSNQNPTTHSKSAKILWLATPAFDSRFWFLHHWLFLSI